MDWSEIFIWIAIGLFMIVVILASFLFTVTSWSEKFQDWLKKKK